MTVVQEVEEKKEEEPEPVKTAEPKIKLKPEEPNAS